MRHVAESVAHGLGAFTLVTVANLQDFAVKVVSGLVIVAITSTASHFVKRFWRHREWSRWAKEHGKHHGPKP